MITTARPPDLELLRAFVAVARRRSFTAAARELGVDKSKLSRQLRALEAHLGVALLSRTTRAVTATAEGASSSAASSRTSMASSSRSATAARASARGP